MIRIAYLQERMPTDLHQRLTGQIEDFQKHRPAADQAFLSLWDDYLIQVGQAQQQGQKSAITAIMVSWLRSEIVIGSHGYRVDAYGKEWFVDFQECSQNWLLDFIWHYWQEDVAYLEQSMLKNHHLPKIFDYEFDYIKLDYAQAYHNLTKMYFISQIEQIRQLASFQTLIKEDDFAIYFGEYLDQAETIFTLD